MFLRESIQSVFAGNKIHGFYLGDFRNFIFYSEYVVVGCIFLKINRDIYLVFQVGNCIIRKIFDKKQEGNQRNRHYQNKTGGKSQSALAPKITPAAPENPFER